MFLLVRRLRMKAAGGMVELLEKIGNIFIDLVCVPFLGDAMFRKGFLVALAVALMLGQGARMFLYVRRQYLAFFAIVQPSLKPSPSPFQRMNGCALGVIVLIILIGIIFVFISAIGTALAR